MKWVALPKRSQKLQEPKFEAYVLFGEITRISGDVITIEYVSGHTYDEEEDAVLPIISTVTLKLSEGKASEDLLEFLGQNVKVIVVNDEIRDVKALNE